ncbi:MAG: hypothetical protein ACRC7N_00410, partial [Clostridium sp.]
GKISDFSSGLWNKANNYISGPTVTNIKNTVSITKQGLSETFSGKSKMLPNNIETLQSISNAGKEIKGRIKFDIDLEIASTKIDDTINIKETTNNLPVLYDEEFANAQRKLYQLGDSEGVGNRKVFTSDDPLVGELATNIEANLPGRVVDVNKVIKGADGKIKTDFDIELDNAILQVKEGGGKGMVSQLERTAKTTNKTVIGYGPDLKGSIVKGANAKGFEVFRSESELIEYLKNLK